VNDEAWPVLTDLPAEPGWEFGGFPYGLEPLTLPPAGAPDLPPAADADYRPICRRIRGIAALAPADAEVVPCSDPELLYWFRWITGHQVSFVIWRLMAQLLDEVVEGQAAWSSVLGPLCHCVRCYTAMLLYTGSCPRGAYHDVIRPTMRLQHPSFSGSWAPDYWPVKDLLRSRRLPFVRTPESADLLQAIREVQLVHDGVAAKLVPDGKSLLRQSTVRRQDVRLLHLMYDNYFLTLRAPVTRQDVVAQLLRRLLAIAHDVAVNDLHPAALAEVDGHPEELCIPEVVACEDGLLETVVQAANCASRLAGTGVLAEDGRSVSFAGC
jgi:L-tyrosine peroxygenase